MKLIAIVLLALCLGSIAFALLAQRSMRLAAMPGAMQKNNDAIHIGLVGDVMIGRVVNQLLRVRPDHNLWGTMLPILHEQDVVIANLETTITHSDDALPKVFNFKTDLAHVRVLEQAHINAVTLANNHIFDYGLVGFQDTVHALNKAGIAYVGANDTAQKARKPYLFSVNNTRFALLGATDNEPSWAAGPNKPGTNYIEIGDLQFLENIKQTQSLADIVIVTLHWGPNMKEYPSTKFIEYAHAMIDAGADIIAGHSAHILQGIEVYNNKIILYDMGDFIDDYAIDDTLRNDLTALFSVTIQDKKVKAVTIVPARIQDMVVNRAHQQDAQKVFEIIKERSLPFNTLFEHANGLLKVFPSNQ